MKISTREIYSLNDEKMSGLNIQQLITVQVSWWCIDNFTIINQECFMCQLPTAHTVHIPTHHQWSLGLHKNKTWMIDHHISHTVPFDKITKCAQVKAINISRVRSSSCFPNVHLVIKAELELPPATADSSGSWGHCFVPAQLCTALTGDSVYLALSPKLTLSFHFHSFGHSGP